MLEDKEPPSRGERKKRSIMSAGMSARLFQRTLHSHLHVLSLDLRFKLEKSVQLCKSVSETESSCQSDYIASCRAPVFKRKNKSCKLSEAACSSLETKQYTVYAVFGAHFRPSLSARSSESLPSVELVPPLCSLTFLRRRG